MIIIYNQLTSIGWSSNTIKQPAPWSSIPLKTLSRIICDNLFNIIKKKKKKKKKL